VIGVFGPASEKGSSHLKELPLEQIHAFCQPKSTEEKCRTLVFRLGAVISMLVVTVSVLAYTSSFRILPSVSSRSVYRC
jgi:hypothetical protein